MDNQKAKEMLRLLNEHEDLIILMAGFVVLFWGSILTPFHTPLSKKISFTDAKAKIENATKSFKNVLKSKDIFVAMCKVVDREPETSEATVDALEIVANKWPVIRRSKPELRNRLLKAAREGVVDSYSKLQRDLIPIEEIPVTADIYPMTNRPQEESFGRYKYKEKKFLKMTRENLSSLARSNINNMSKWLSAHPHRSELMEMVKKSNAANGERRALPSLETDV